MTQYGRDDHTSRVFDGDRGRRAIPEQMQVDRRAERMKRGQARNVEVNSVRSMPAYSKLRYSQGACWSFKQLWPYCREIIF